MINNGILYAYQNEILTFDRLKIRNMHTGWGIQSTRLQTRKGKWHTIVNLLNPLNTRATIQQTFLINFKYWRVFKNSLNIYHCVYYTGKSCNLIKILLDIIPFVDNNWKKRIFYLKIFDANLLLWVCSFILYEASRFKH